MEKRYQVFVSSTFDDLKEERRRVIQSLLELDCIPAGMELFQASDEDQWSLIMDVIDDSDYYLVIVGGRYGSMKDGISYTEMEYDYAVEKGKPVLGFVHGNPGEIKSDRIDGDTKKSKRLELFRKKVLGKPCKKWESPDGLAAAVISSVSRMKRIRPEGGWVKAKYASDPETILRYRNEIDELKKMAVSPPAWANELSQGSDTMSLRCRCNVTYVSKPHAEIVRNDRVLVMWDELFYNVGPVMMKPCSENDIRLKVDAFVRRKYASRLNPGEAKASVFVNNEDLETVKIQFLALGLISKQQCELRPSKWELTWTLTPYGESYLVMLRSVKREKLFPDMDQLDDD